MPTFEISQLLLILPEIVLLSGTSFILIISLFLGNKNKQVSYYLSQLVLLATIFFSFQLLGKNTIIFDGAFIIDDIAIFSKIFILVFSMILLEYTKDYLNTQNMFKAEYLVLMLLSIFGMLIMVSGYGFIMLYLGLEIMSLSLYSIIAMANTRSLAVEAALKYFTLGAIASGILLYGMSLIYGATGSLNIGEISDIIATGNSSLLIVNFAIVFLIIGIAFKLGAVPFHMWVPDVYQGSTLSTTMFLSSIPKIAVVVMFVRILTDGLSFSSSYWSDIIMFLGLFSIIVGSLIALVQTNIKRLLAYSTISHIGFILVAFSLGSDNGYSMAIFYTWVYVFSSIAVFGIIIALSNKYIEIDKITDLTGIGKTNPVFGISMLFVILSMAGVPPLIGFYAKFTVLNEVIASGKLLVAITMVVFSVIGAFYYLKIIKTMYFDDTKNNRKLNNSFSTEFLLILNSFALLLLGLFPDYFIDLAYGLF